MANSEYITRTDLETVIQKVRIENQEQEVKIANASEITRPLIEEEKKKSLKEIEERLEERSIFQDLGDGIKSLNTSIVDGFSNLANSLKEKGKGILGVIANFAGIIAGLVISPLIALGGFFGQLGTEIRFLNKITGGKLSKLFKPLITFFRNIKTLGLKTLGKIINAFPKVKGFLTSIGNVFGSVSKFFSNSKGFSTIVKFASSIGRILGKVFLPITILFGIFDFVKGFMKGYKEDGIIGGITEGIVAVFDGLVGGLLRLLAWVPKKIFEVLGLDNLAASIMPAIETILDSIKNTFRGLVDVVVGIFTLDGTRIKEGLSGVFNSILSLMTLPFTQLKAFIQDIFGIEDPFTIVKESLLGLWQMITGAFVNLKDAIPLFIKEQISNIPGAGLVSGLLDSFFGNAKETRVVQSPPRQLATDYSSPRRTPSLVSQPQNTNNQTNNNVSNTISYNIQGNTTLASDALNFATT